MKNDDSIILFDGICNLCSSSVDFILKRDKKKQFEFVPLQSEKGVELMDKYKIPEESDSVILIRGNKVFTESDAATEISRLLPAPWSWAVAFKIVPQKWRNAIYRWIAKNRYQWFGKRESCRLI